MQAPRLQEGKCLTGDKGDTCGALPTTGRHCQNSRRYFGQYRPTGGCRLIFPAVAAAKRMPPPCPTAATGEVSRDHPGKPGLLLTAGVLYFLYDRFTCLTQ